MTITLRPQQVEFKESVRAALLRVRRVLGTGPTGFGKGVVLADMTAEEAAKGHHPLLVTHRQVVVHQLQQHCYNAGIRTGIIMGNIGQDEEAEAQVASIHTLERRGYGGLRPRFILIDEAHQMYDAYRRLCERYPDVPVLGMTATPVGPGGAKIGHFDEVVEPIRNTEVIAAGDLLKVHPYFSPSEPDLSGVDLKRVSKKDLGERVEACTIRGDVFKAWKPYQHMQTLWVFPSRAVCNQWHRMMMARGYSAKIVDGTTPQEERDNAFSEFKETDCQNLLGVDVVREGLDLPVAQCLVDLQPTHQFRVYWQKLGRVKRPHDGQETAAVIDFAGNIDRHLVHPDHDPPWNEVTSDQTIEEINERKAGVRCPECGSKDIYSIEGGRYKCEDCKHDWTTKRPWVCPRCFQAMAPWQKAVGGVCPNCGEKVSIKPVRRIRMIDGSLRVVSADEIKRRKKCKADAAQACWDKFRCIAHNMNKKIDDPAKRKTLNWCGYMYKKEMGRWPSGLKYCPGYGSADWRREPGKVYPWMK
jgi:superfamily II DNA or RNA helicase